MSSPFLTAVWKNLIMANYTVDPAVLSPFIPNRTALDRYAGNVYVSLVGFMFTDTRVMGLKIPFHINFEEVNLRFYVRYNDRGQWKRGTVFIKEIVPKPAISFIANAIYHEKYCTKKMSHYVDTSAAEIKAGYQWKHRDKWNKLEVVAADSATAMLAGSEEAFIAEHYWGYSRFDDTTTSEYNVQHEPWEIYPVKGFNVDCDLTALYGESFSSLNAAEPDSVLLAKGSAIAVFKKRKL
jgi:uncharacterized protein YqjF (DUF2071 family)